MEIFYVITNGLVKISILLLYLQLFPGKRFRLQCWMVFAFIVAHTVTFAFATIFQCSPVQYTFDKDIVGRCINYNAVAWAHAGLNILQDLLLIALPLPELRGLRLTLKRKMGLVTLFGLWGL